MPRVPISTPEKPRAVERLLNLDGYLARLDARGWNRVLLKVFRLSAKYDLGLVEMLPNMTFLSRVGVGGGVGVTTIGQIGMSTVQFIEPRSEGLQLNAERLPVLLVNLDAPDAVIIEDVKRTLLAVRQHIEGPVTLPGRRALNSKFTGKVFDRWRHKKIVQLAYLLFMNARRKANRLQPYSQEVLGEWLEMGDPKKDASGAKKTLKKALKSLPDLWNQIRQEDLAEDLYVKLTAAAISKVVSGPAR
jgi:hypothetical protein